MKSKKQKSIFLLAALMTAMFVAWYLLLDGILKAFLESGKPAWLSEFVETIYPRYKVESQRMDTEKLLLFAGQVYLRSVLVGGLLGSLFIYRKSFISFLNKRKPANSPLHFRLVFSFLVIISLWYCREWYFDYNSLYSYSFLYEPRGFYSLFSIPLISKGLYGTLYIIMILSFVGSLFIQRARFWLQLTASALWIFLQGYFYCFGKVDHGFHTFNYLIMLLPFFVWENKGEIKSHSFILLAMQMVIALVYFQAGLEKLSLSGFQWFDPKHLEGYLLLHKTSVTPWLVEKPWLISLGAVIVIIIQISFPLAVFLRKYTFFWVAGIILFHIGVYVVMDINNPDNPWIASLIVFLGLNKFTDKGRLPLLK